MHILLLTIYTLVFSWTDDNGFAKTLSSNSGSLQPAYDLINYFSKIYKLGNTELYLTGYAWHNRYRYEHARLKDYNERSFGGVKLLNLIILWIKII